MRPSNPTLPRSTIACRHVVPVFIAFGAALVVSAADLEKAPDTDAGRLTIERIYQSDDFSSKSYSGRWKDDSSGYFQAIPSVETQGGRDILLIDPGSGGTNVVVAAQDLIPAGESSPLDLDEYTFSKDESKLLIYTNSKKVWRRRTRGDYWVFDRTGLGLKQLGGDAEPATLMHAKFSPDGFRVGYVHERNLHVEDLRTGEIQQLTDTGGEHVINGTFDWVYEEELSIYDGWRWSPDSSSIVFWELDTTGVKRYPLVDYTAGLYPEIKWIEYPKTGEQNSRGRIGMVKVKSGRVQWLAVPGDPRNHYVHFLEWNEETGGPVLQQLNRRQNQNRFYRADPKSGEVDLLFEETDPAWVDVRTGNKWAGEGDMFPWLSERDGWRQIYRVNSETGKQRQVYDEPIDVEALSQFVEETGELYFIASPDNATQRHLYRSKLSGAKPERVTPDDQPGSHSYNISPDGKWAIHTWSAFDQPPITELVRLPGHEVVRVFEDNEKLKETFSKVDQTPVEFLQVPVHAELSVDAYCIKPPDFDPETKYPVIVYVYGEPAGQTVRDSWGGSGMLWHRFLAQKGFVVFSFDNRGTPAPKGREWRKSVYRKVGIIAPQDQAAALRRVLADRPYLDADRVGIWGWSGGGSMTLNALFKYPDLYHAGISVAAVPNQRYYDTIYQERYMGLPNDNVEGYREGSPLFFAHQLEGDLLLVHGTGDDNVHYQGFEVLVDRLVHHNKQFRTLAYPNRSHGIGEEQNTTIHLRQAMWDFWREKLLNRSMEIKDEHNDDDEKDAKR